MKMDTQLYSLIDNCRIAKQNWMIEQEKPEEPRRGRSAPPSPAEIAHKAFMDASNDIAGAAPKTLEGWRAKWRQIVEHETEFDAGDASFNLKMMKLMLTEFEALVVVKAIAVA
jgi:hypothetical protein